MTAVKKSKPRAAAKELIIMVKDVEIGKNVIVCWIERRVTGSYGTLRRLIWMRSGQNSRQSLLS